jgi:ribosomal protein S18 acetylase RimI-like enzyme
MLIVILGKNELKKFDLKLFSSVVFSNFSELDNETLDHSENSIYNLLKSDSVKLYLIVSNDHKILAYILGKIMKLNDGRDVFYITYLYTSSEHRNKGYASILINLVNKTKIDEKLNGIMLTCNSTDDKIYNFYINKGFMPDIILRTYAKHEVMFKY